MTANSLPRTTPLSEAFEIPGDIIRQSQNNPEGQLEDAILDKESGDAVAVDAEVYTVFSKRTKIWIITMVTASSFVSPMTANIYFPAIKAISTDFQVPVGLINLTLTTYMICQGLSPTLFGDFGDMTGRRPAFILAFLIYFVANVGLALQDRYPALLVLRMLQSAGSSGTLALGYAVVADISVSGERGKYMSFIDAGINLGPTAGPVLGGVLTEYLGWRSLFWFCAIYAGAWLLPYFITVPETSRNVVGNGSVRPQKWNMTLLDYANRRREQDHDASTSKSSGFRFPNPLVAFTTVFRKDMALLLVLGTLLYLVFMISVATLSPIYAEIYQLNNLYIGLCYLPYGFGCCMAALAKGFILDWNYRRIARKNKFKIDYIHGDDLSHFPIEQARIQLVVPLVICGVAATIGYGWALHFRAPLAVALVLIFTIGFTVTGAFGIIQTLIIDLNPQATATAVASVNLTRCLIGAAVMAFIDPMLTALGRGWCFTSWALLCAATSPVLAAVQRHGPRWREDRRLKELEDNISAEETVS
jgi:multidrug resistance protein